MPAEEIETLDVSVCGRLDDIAKEAVANCANHMQDVLQERTNGELERLRVRVCNRALHLERGKTLDDENGRLVEDCREGLRTSEILFIYQGTSISNNLAVLLVAGHNVIEAHKIHFRLWDSQER